MSLYPLSLSAFAMVRRGGVGWGASVVCRGHVSVCVRRLCASAMRD